MGWLISEERVLECAGLRNTMDPIAYDSIDDLQWHRVTVTTN
jgi:hypothetical protein